jgi:hypothetical protein
VSGRRITTAVTLLVLLLVLAGMAVYGFKSLTSPLPGRAAAKQTCTGAEKQLDKFLERSEVQVSVFNAGTRSGLASSTLDQIETAGFRAGNAGNAPKGAKVGRVVIWTTTPDDPAAALVAKAFGRRTKVVVTSTDLGPGIDVLVGNRLTGLAPHAPRRIKLAAPVETCVPVS